MHTPMHAPGKPLVAASAKAKPHAARLHLGGVAFALLVLAMPGTALTQPAGESAAPGSSYTTVANDSVWRLAGLALGSTRGDRTQAMVAILRLNPDAFMLGNLHRLKRGVTLTLPTPEAIMAEDARQASMLLESHLQALAVPGVLASPPAPLAREAGAAPKPVAKATPTPTPQPTPAPATPTAKAPVATPTPAPAATTTPLAKAPVAATPTPVASPAPSPIASPAPSPSPTPSATSTPTPAATAPLVTPPASVARTPVAEPGAAASTAPATAPTGAAASAATEPAAAPVATPRAATPAATASGPGLDLTTRLLPYAMLLLLLALPLAWWVYRQRTRGARSMRDRLRAASTDFQDSKDASRGLKPKRVDVSNAAVDVARVVETLGPVTLMVKHADHEPQPGAAPLSMAELREQAGLKLEIARASLEVGRAMVARTLLAAVQREGDASERQAADELMLKLA